MENLRLSSAAPPDRLGLLCGDIKDANFLTAILAGVRPDLPVDVLFTREALEEWATLATPRTRLISFCTGVVVPGEVLAVLSGPAYNFHPGPPAYPGKHPAVFALYENAPTFGATLHEMTVPVDSGPIVGVTEFPVPADVTALWLETRAHQAALHLFLHSISALAHQGSPLEHTPVSWGACRCSRRAFQDFCTVPPDISADEIKRRQRIIAQIPGATLHMVVHGQRFDLSSCSDQQVNNGETRAVKTAAII